MQILEEIVTNISVLVFVLVFLVYQAARQFMAQRVNLLTLLLLPVLSAYASYTELVPAFAHYRRGAAWTQPWASPLWMDW